MNLALPPGDRSLWGWSLPGFIKEAIMPKQTVFPFARNPFEGLSADDLSNTEAEHIIALALAVLEKRHRPGQAIDSPETMRSYLRLKLADYRNEVFGLVLMDNRHRIIADVELFQGTIDGASIYPRVVVQKALELNAASVVLYHNHPSGVAEPSHADENITKRLKAALALVDIRVLDHLVVSAGEAVSFAEKGLI
jgi:DNA repair protein RadC